MAQQADRTEQAARQTAREARRDREQAYLAGELEVVAIPRAWIRAHGGPDCYADAVALTADPANGTQRLRRTRSSLIQESYQAAPPNVAYYREGPQGQAFLFVQAWTGPA